MTTNLLILTVLGEVAVAVILAFVIRELVLEIKQLRRSRRAERQFFDRLPQAPFRSKRSAGCQHREPWIDVGHPDVEPGDPYEVKHGK